ncbi:amino acid ABC transporter permease [Bosea sp. F3-2]|uniref:amino acid ABC transporter permease n=1 Tax=Bosea sp. F3-2 TaxID=2599640 RepID=UPI0011EF84D2|nr:amino acid ABC transporter permease [Bosea sp. F3-2]QEL23796.1 amino acid ABC transporter permease [Bosea sp. F3-2]
MNYRWDWSVLIREPFVDWLWSGLLLTLAISIVSWAVALAIGIVVGVARSSPSRVARLLAGIYIDVFRSVPPLVQLFLWYFVLPEIVPDVVGLWLKRDLPYPEIVTAVIAIGLFAGSRVAEQVRAGIEAVGAPLLPAALATGLRPMQAFRLIALPLGLRAIVGPLTSEFLITIKLSSLSLTIGVLELTAQSRHVENYTFQGFEAFTFATIGYLVIGLCATGLMRLIDSRIGGAALRKATT